jgi:hypothetical protein
MSKIKNNPSTIIFPSRFWARKIIAGIILLIFFIPAFSNNVSAQGIGVAPGRVIVEATQGETVKKQLIVFNPSDEPTLFSAQAEKLGDWLSFAPQESLLLGGKNKKVIVEVKAKKPGTYKDTIYVRLKSENNRNNSLALQLAAAVSIEIFVKSKQNRMIGAAVASSIVIAGLGIYTLSRRYRQTSLTASL